MKNKLLLVLLIITLTGGFLRFWKLSEYPVSLSIDEVATGYNSYSILKTGRDEYGTFFPLAFRSIGDYKPPVLVYLMAPAIAVFGLNEFGVRFTVAMIGALSIPLVFLLVKQITKNNYLALLTSFSLAISPWHINYSRASFEAILALFFVLLGVWIFHRSLEKEGRLLWLAGACFALSIYTYHAERIFTPLFILGIVFIYRKALLAYKSETLKMFVILLVLLLPFFKIMLGPEGQTRAKATFISQDEQISYQLHQAGEKLGIPDKILDNNAVILGNFWVKRYLNYWDPSFLFFRGMKFSLPGAPDTGVFYLFELPLFLIGLYLLFFKDVIRDSNTKKLLILWLLIGPLAASLANNDQHALRSLTAIPAPHLLVALGGWFTLGLTSKYKLKQKIIGAFLVFPVVALNIFYVVNLYTIHYPIQFSEYWSYGLKEASLYAWEHQKEYKEIVFDPAFGTEGPYTVSVPYLYALFYGQYDPYLFQTDPRRKENEGSINFANFTFRSIYWSSDKGKERSLFIGSPWSLSPLDLKKEQILKVINFKNGVPGFYIVETGKINR